MTRRYSAHEDKVKRTTSKDIKKYDNLAQEIAIDLFLLPLGFFLVYSVMPKEYQNTVMLGAIVILMGGFFLALKKKRKATMVFCVIYVIILITILANNR